MNRNWKYLFFFILIVGFYSCKSSRKVTGHTTIKPLKAKEILTNFENHNIIDSGFSIRYTSSVELENKKHDLKGMIRLKKDSIIWISIGPSRGIELFRLILSPDSVKYINRTNQTYYIGNYDYINKLVKFELNFDWVQSFLLADLISFQEYPLKYSNIESNMYCIRNYKERSDNYYKSDKNRIKQKVYINPNTYQIHKVWMQEEAVGRIMFYEYKQFKEFGIKQLPEEINFSFRDKSNVDLNIKYQRITTGENLRFPFQVSKKYSRIG